MICVYCGDFVDLFWRPGPLGLQQADPDRKSPEKRSPGSKITSLFYVELKPEGVFFRSDFFNCFLEGGVTALFAL